MGLKYRSISIKTIYYLIAIALSLSVASCGKIDFPSGVEGFSVPEIKNVAFDNFANGLSEVAPPDVIQQLDRILLQYQPQVAILRPQQNATIEDTTVEVSLAVEDYPLFQDDRLGLGHHLNLIVDNEHYAEIYNLEEPIILKNLKPGTHTLRVIAEKPWHESFKNESAYAQTTFNVVTETTDNNPDLDLPLLTYNQPMGVYSTEPILLDFYLAGIVTKDWQVRATINEESFIIDEWQPIYLQGFQEGNNLIQLELLDGSGEVISNQFNQPIRLITYDETSSEQDTLAQLVSGKISFEEAVAIAEQNYYIQPVGEPEIIDTITEELSIESPAEEDIEENSEPSVEETLEETVTEDRETAEIESTDQSAEKTLNEKTEEAISDTVEETIDTEEATSIKELEKEAEKNTETTPESIIEPQEAESQQENKEITTTPVAGKNSVSTNSVIEETTSPKKDNVKILEGITEIPVPEEILAVETTESITASDTIEIPQPKLKVPQWWNNLVANFQQRFNINR
ncbi:conserved hypothetical protein [Hyella patelloides LEGE 07179]|uniref:Uncharacterized protein n=1 Tax=Hyella patelloides LEGE 07179 TaxID=945734 RepID=A0A563VUA6_9CYAN|nr:hypothetical protein [Hyella patelloides]VEP14974.1 conserved hypothetical protein [Hyella patelloides LEGE 07179]